MPSSSLSLSFPICNKAVVLDDPLGQLWEATWLVRRMLQSLAALTPSPHPVASEPCALRQVALAL